MATLAPSPANRIAVARPIPLPPPVMKTTLPASLGIDLSFAIADMKRAGGRRSTMRYRSDLARRGECHARHATVRSSLVRRGGDRRRNGEAECRHDPATDRSAGMVDRGRGGLPGGAPARRGPVSGPGDVEPGTI